MLIIIGAPNIMGVAVGVGVSTPMLIIIGAPSIMGVAVCVAVGVGVSRLILIMDAPAPIEN